MKSSRLIFPIFLLITLIAFYPTIGAGFVFDFLGWQRAYDAGTFTDIFTSFGYKGNHQALHFFFYSLYSIFHIQGLPWYLIFCSLHAFNGWLLFTWLTQINTRWKINAPGLLIILMCILFLVHPYNVEVVVWKVCVHYLLSLAAVMALVLFIPKYLYQADTKFLWLCLGMYFVSIFLLEIAYITPLVISLYLAIEAFAGNRSEFNIRRAVTLSSSLWILLAFGILLNKLTIGAWVGHYGAAAHLNIDIIGMMSTEFKYLVKHIADARFFSFKTKGLIFDNLLSKPELVFFLMMMCIGIALLYFIRIKKVSGYVHLVFFGMAASMLYVLPVSNLFFYHLQIGSNDRFSYLPLVFIIVAFLPLFSKTPKWVWVPLMGIIILVQLYLQEKTINYWRQSTEIVHQLRDTFRWHDRSHVFVLNSPDNLNGIVMTSIIQAPSGIDELLDFQTSKPYTGVMYDVFQYNMTTPNDGVKVEQTGPMQIKVTFNQWGNWWHLSGIGASSYENEYFKAETLDYPYQLTFKQFPEGSAIIYQDGKEWKEFKLKVKSEE
ncbi:MAG: hypothetical protein IPN60_04080 [Saprospiraceae bacterium]|nr:hypothetical protein [Candidatus Opimibacter skivensis]